MRATLTAYHGRMAERRTDRPFVYVQLRVPNELHAELERVSVEDKRPIHSELLTMLETWTRLPRHRRLAIEHEATTL